MDRDLKNKRGFEMLYQQIAFIIFILFIILSSIVFVTNSRQALKLDTQCKEIALLLSYAEPSIIEIKNFNTNAKIEVDSENHKISLRTSTISAVKCTYYSDYDIDVNDNILIIRPKQ
jgi:hypothetical protein